MYHYFAVHLSEVCRAPHVFGRQHLTVLAFLLPPLSKDDRVRVPLLSSYKSSKLSYGVNQDNTQCRADPLYHLVEDC
jgi:hypothetical protein